MAVLAIWNGREVADMIALALAVIVLLITSITVTALPRPYPTWPTLGAVPINPELSFPALLGLVVVLRTIGNGLSLDSLFTGVLGAVTFWLATNSLYTLYIGDGGGVLWDGFFTLISGVILAVVVIGQEVIQHFG